VAQSGDKEVMLQSPT